MKRMIATIIVGVVIAAGIGASAQNHPNAQLVRVEGQGPAFTISCTVNGVTYGVDSANNIWGVNLATGQLVIIGHLYVTAYGPVAVDLYGNRYPAYC